MMTSDHGARDRAGTAGPRAAALTLAASLVLVTGALGYVDGTGLFAPENWLDAGFVPGSAASPAWATVVFLPLLVIGGATALLGTVRSAAPGVRPRWVLGATWSGLVVTAVAAKLVYSLLLLAVAGPHHLHAAATAEALLAECGLTGAKYAFFGILAAGPTALVYWIAARREIRAAKVSRAAARTTRAALAAGAEAGTGAEAESEAAPASPAPELGWSRWWLIVGVLLAATVAHGGYGWADGTAHTLVLPFAGLIGAVLMLAFLWPRVAPGLAVDSGLALGWVRCCVTAAASALGFLLPFVVDGAVNGFGGGLYPVIGALMHVAAGVTAGICAALVATAWARLRTRPRIGALAGRVDRRFPAGSRVARPALTACVLALAVGVQTIPAALAGEPAASPVPHAASADGGGLLPLTVLRADGASPVIGDSAGRQVLLRGANVNQLLDYGQRDPEQPTVRDLTDDDYRQMAEDYGFDVQRLALSWSRVEPRRGDFDHAYLARVRAAVDQAAAHGIYTVLDMHQDTYSKYVTAAPGTTCRPGSTPEFGNDGAPEWATLAEGAKGCGFQGRDLSPNVEQSFTNLYDDTDGIGAQLAASWAELARAFAGDTAVAGYDLLNEPGPGDAPGVTSSLLLGRLYEQVTSAIRAGEDAVPGGFHHLVFFEPSILWSGLGFDLTPPAGFSGDPDLVFSPHLYSESITMDQGLGVTLTTIEQGFAAAERTAAAYGVPLWSGEWGWFGTGTQLTDRYRRFLDRQNADALGSAIWVWKKACGDPQTDPAGPTSGGLVPLSCPDGADMPSPGFLRAALGQAYPRSAPGRIRTLTSSPVDVDLKLTGKGSGTLDVWIPASDTAKPTVTTEGLTDISLVAQSGGGWRLTAVAAGAYGLTAAR